MPVDSDRGGVWSRLSHKLFRLLLAVNLFAILATFMNGLAASWESGLSGRDLPPTERQLAYLDGLGSNGVAQLADHEGATPHRPAGGEIAAEFFDVGQSRSLPWSRRPEAANLLEALGSSDRNFDAFVVGAALSRSTDMSAGLGHRLQGRA